MCGRFVLSRKSSLTNTPVNWRELCLLLTGYNIGPSQDVFVVVPSSSGDLVPIRAAWGISNVYQGGLTINARSETVAEKPMFRESFRIRRCLVPADGWYEWATVGGKKQPHFISPSSGELLMFAGLYQAGPGGKPAMVILTKEATPEIAFVHNRMPVLIGPDAWTRWLSATTTAPELAALLQGAPIDLKAVPVSNRVGNVRNDDSGLIAPVTPIREEPGLFG